MTDEIAVTPAEPTLIDGKRRAAAVLEVLAGARSPSEAAQVIGVTLPAYYQIEARALQGLIDACEPRKRGRQPLGVAPDVERLRAEVLRQQSLLRSLQRSIGLQADESVPAAPGRRGRKPSVRALRAARKLLS